MKIKKFAKEISINLSAIEQNPSFEAKKIINGTSVPCYFFDFEPRTKRGKKFWEFYLECAKNDIDFTYMQMSARTTIVMLEISIGRFFSKKI